MTLVFAIVHLSKTVRLLNDLTNEYPIPVTLCVKLASQIFNYTCVLLIGYLSNLCTFLYVAWLRTPKYETLSVIDFLQLVLSGKFTTKQIPTAKPDSSAGLALSERREAIREKL